MDINPQQTKMSSTGKRSDNLHKASSILSVVAILLTVALFLRTETNTKMLDAKFTLKIKQIRESLESEQAIRQGREKDSDVSRGRS